MGDNLLAGFQAFIQDTPISLLFLGFVAIIVAWALLGAVKDSVMWVFWNVIWYLLPFLLWHFHPQLKPWYAWLWLAAAKAWSEAGSKAKEFLDEEVKDKV